MKRNNKTPQITFKYRSLYSKTTLNVPYPDEIINAAQRLAFTANKITSPAPTMRNGVIDDETLGLDFAADALNLAFTELQKDTRKDGDLLNAVNSLRELAQYKFVGAIAPEEDPIEWVKGRIEAMCEKLVSQAEFFQWYFDNYSFAVNTMSHNDAFESLKESIAKMIKDKNEVAIELHNELNIIDAYLIGNFDDELSNEGTAKNVKLLLADLILKRAALDDTSSQFKEEVAKNKQKDEVLAQAREQLKVLNPNPANFDQILKLVLQYVVNNPTLVTTGQRQLLTAISSL